MPRLEKRWSDFYWAALRKWGSVNEAIELTIQEMTDHQVEQVYINQMTEHEFARYMAMEENSADTPESTGSVEELIED